MRLATVAAVPVFMLAALVPAASAQDGSAAQKTGTLKASEFKPPLSAGIQRRYDKSPQTVAAAVRDAMKAGQFRLLSEQPVESMTVFEAIVRSWRNMPTRDKVRIVVEPISEKQTAVRVYWAAASSFQPGSSAEGLYFLAIESHLK